MYKLDKESIKQNQKVKPNIGFENLKIFGGFALCASAFGIAVGTLYNQNLQISSNSSLLDDTGFGAVILFGFSAAVFAFEAVKNLRKEKPRWNNLLSEFIKSKVINKPKVDFDPEDDIAYLQSQGFKTAQQLSNERFVHDAYRNDKVVPIQPFLYHEENETQSSPEKGYSKVLTKNGSGNNSSDNGIQL